MFVDYIKKYEKWSLIGSILMFILGLVLVINPLGSVNIFIKIFGVILIVDGVMHMIDYFLIEPEARIMSLDLVEGIFSVISGISIIACSRFLTGILPIMMSIWIIIKSVFHFQNALNLKAIPGSGWGWLLVLSILTFALGLIIIINPFPSAEITLRTLGIFVLVSELVNIIESIVTLIKLRKA